MMFRRPATVTMIHHPMTVTRGDDDDTVGDDDDDPPFRLELFTTAKVTVPGRGVEGVVAPVVLDQDLAQLATHQVQSHPPDPQGCGTVGTRWPPHHRSENVIEDAGMAWHEA